jgi:hypothetical protein
MHSMIDMERNPDINLITKFEACTKETEILQQYDELCLKENDKGNNFLLQRRITITPTLIIVSRGLEEESNRVIR